MGILKWEVFLESHGFSYLEVERSETMRDFQFHTKHFSIIWSINYNASVMGSNIQCDVMKQNGETVSVG